MLVKLYQRTRRRTETLLNFLEQNDLKSLESISSIPEDLKEFSMVDLDCYFKILGLSNLAIELSDEKLVGKKEKEKEDKDKDKDRDKDEEERNLIGEKVAPKERIVPKELVKFFYHILRDSSNLTACSMLYISLLLNSSVIVHFIENTGGKWHSFIDKITKQDALRIAEWKEKQQGKQSYYDFIKETLKEKKLDKEVKEVLFILMRHLIPYCSTNVHLFSIVLDLYERMDEIEYPTPQKKKWKEYKILLEDLRIFFEEWSKKEKPENLEKDSFKKPNMEYEHRLFVILDSFSFGWSDSLFEINSINLRLLKMMLEKKPKFTIHELLDNVFFDEESLNEKTQDKEKKTTGSIFSFFQKKK